MNKKIAITISLVFALAAVAGAQKKLKPWTEWSEKEINKILNDSAWGQTQTDANTSEMFYSPNPPDNSTGSSGSGANNRAAQGALNQATYINYRIRLLTAKPIRQALARRAQIQNPQLAEKLKAFAEQQTDEYIIVAVDYDSTDRRLSGPSMQIFNS